MRELWSRSIARLLVVVGLAALPLTVLALLLVQAALAFGQSPSAPGKSKTVPTKQPPRTIAEPKGGKTIGDARVASKLPTEKSAAVQAPTAPSSERFKINPNFRIDVVAPHAVTGSLIALSFDEDGRLLVARENGPLVRLLDQDGDGQPETPQAVHDAITNVQGILSLDGKLYVVGQGPEGVGLFVLSKPDGDGIYADRTRLIAFDGKPGEHGPHGLALGPDGFLYLMAGNHAQLSAAPADSSPYRHAYEGDLVQPRHEDPNGHSLGVKAPGGTVLRIDREGKKVEVFAGGLRNAYDLAFNGAGELLTHDSDMEWDLGAPWYRPTRVLHVTPGAEFGWRSGWANWPEYYLDSLPATLDTGGGSPAGMVVYQHVMMPLSLQGALFTCDWAKGRIVLFRLRPSGSTYQAEGEVFVEGDPLNATDIAVGPDGYLYFCTGGRGTEGGVYRIVWKGKVPDKVLDFGRGITAALRQPQLEAAWARRRVAGVREELKDQWEPQLIAAVKQTNLPVEQRVRALELLQWLGPSPRASLLAELTKDAQAAMRARAAYLLGLHGDATTSTALHALVNDADAAVRRVALESMVRAKQCQQVPGFTTAITGADRHLSFAARRALERMPKSQWQSAVLAAPDVRVFLTGGVALLTVEPDRATARSILDRSRQIMQGYVSDHDFLDLLRVQQLAILRGALTSDDTADLRKQLAEEYPSRSATINRELVRLLAHLQEASIGPRALEQLLSTAPLSERLFLAMHLPRLNASWTTEEKLQIVQFYEQARASEGGLSLGRYVERSALEFGRTLNADQQRQVLQKAAEWPTTAMAVLAQLPKDLSPETLSQLRELDRQTEGQRSDAVTRLRVAIVAVLARSGADAAMAYLREVFDREPERRATVAMGLAQSPGGDNWPLLVRALPVLEGAAAQEVLRRLAEVDRRPEDPEAIRQVILRGLKLRDHGASRAIALLEKWSGQSVSASDEPWEPALAKWQAWFVARYPQHAEPKLPVDGDGNRWAFDKLHEYLTAPTTQGDALRGAEAFVKAQCAKCHRYGDRGESLGPELTTVARRFQKREILESILFPSHVVSDQYASKSVLTHDGRAYTGIVLPDDTGAVTLVLPTAEKVTLAQDEIETIAPSAQSVMPEGLLNDLSAQEIADLFAFLSGPSSAQASGKPAVKR